MGTRLAQSEIAALAQMDLVFLSKLDIRGVLARLDDMPQQFDDLIGALDEAQAAATDANPVLVVLRISG